MAMRPWSLLALLCCVATAAEEPCETSAVLRCLPALGGDRDFPDDAEKLAVLCEQVMSGLECAQRHIDSCSSEEERRLYRNLTRDMVGANAALCTAGSDTNALYLRHASCFRETRDDFRACSDRYVGSIVAVHALSTEQQIKKTCCTVREYGGCMRRAVAGRCEREAEVLVEDTVLRALDATFRYCGPLAEACAPAIARGLGGATALSLSPLLLALLLLTISPWR